MNGPHSNRVFAIRVEESPKISQTRAPVEHGFKSIPMAPCSVLQVKREEDGPHKPCVGLIQPKRCEQVGYNAPGANLDVFVEISPCEGRERLRYFHPSRYSRFIVIWCSILVYSFHELYRQSCDCGT